MILTDNETKVDLLNNEAIAATIIGLLRAKPDHSVTIGVHATGVQVTVKKYSSLLVDTWHYGTLPSVHSVAAQLIILWS